MKYPQYIYESVRDHWAIGRENTECDSEIDQLSKSEVLDIYLKVNNGVSYSSVIIDVVKDIYGVDLNNYE